MKLNFTLFTLIFAIVASALKAESPVSLSNCILRFTISSGSGVFATNGEYFLLPDKDNSGYELISISGNVNSSTGTYNYTKESDTTGTVVANDSQAGISINQILVFTSSDQGTFSHSNAFGSQNGTFTFNYRFSPSELGKVKVDEVYLLASDGKVDFTFGLYESTNLESWTRITPTNCELSDQVSLRVSPPSGKNFYRLTIEETE